VKYVIYLIAPVVVYLLAAFIMADFDFRNWSEVARGNVAVMVVGGWAATFVSTSDRLMP